MDILLAVGFQRAAATSQETDMIQRVLLILTAAFVLAGCNTIQGAGGDIERGGEKIQDAAGKAKR